jgi:hypothetical protein
MKKSDQVIGHRIDARDVRPFMLVVMEATPCKILKDRLAAVLLSDDMVHLKRQRIEGRGHATIVATIPREDLQFLKQGLIHGLRRFFVDGCTGVCNDRRALD